MSSLDRVEAYFKQCPGVWIDAVALMSIGGMLSFRTRISDLRLKCGMVIENRLIREGSRVVRSEYRWMPSTTASSVLTSDVAVVR